MRLQRFIIFIYISILLIPHQATNAYFATRETVGGVINTDCWESPTIPIASPKNLETTTGISILLSWSMSTSSCAKADISYLVQVFDNVDLKNQPLYTFGPTNNTYTSFTLLDPGTYYWLVAAFDQYENISDFEVNNLVVTTESKDLFSMKANETEILLSKPAEAKSTEIIFTKPDNSNLSFRVQNLEGRFQTLEYEISYLVEGEPKGMHGEAYIEGASEFVRDNLFIGVCSDGGVCVPEAGSKFVLIVKLKDTQSEVTRIERTL